MLAVPQTQSSPTLNPHPLKTFVLQRLFSRTDASLAFGEAGRDMGSYESRRSITPLTLSVTKSETI
jgi:hypothetical protein